jgi:Tol biopolymer transport system component
MAAMTKSRRATLGVAAAAMAGLVLAFTANGSVTASASRGEAAMPGSGRIAFAMDTSGAPDCCGPDNTFNIAKMRPDGSHVTQLTHFAVGKLALDPDWSPNGEKIVFSLFPSGRLQHTQLWVVNADGSHTHRLLSDGYIEQSPNYSPNGSNIIFSRCRTDFSACTIVEVRADGSIPRVLLPMRTDDFATDPEYSPNGRRIVFRGDLRGAADDIYVMRSDGTHVHRITPARSDGERPGWTPDGRHVLFTKSCCSIWRIRADGTHPVRLTSPRHGRNDFTGTDSYSPNGHRIAFERDAPDFASYFSIWVMNANGTDQHKIGPPRSVNPTWGYVH